MDNIKLFAKNIRFLRKQKGLTQLEMAVGLGFKQTAWSGYELANSTPNFSDLMKIIKYFGVSASELLESDLENVEVNTKPTKEKKQLFVEGNNEGIVEPNPQNDSFKLTFSAEPQAEYEGHLVPVPITDISVAAGSGYYNQDYVSNVDAIRLPVSLLKRGNTYLCVKIKGPSMAPTLQDGGYVVIRLLDKGEWAKMPDERVFVVADVDGKAYLKRVKNRFKQGFIVLRSDNPDQANFGSFNLTTDEINTIWAVEWYFTAKMPNIHDQYYTRLQRIEDRLEDLINGNLKINPKLK